MSEKRGKWTRLSSRVVHENEYYKVRQDKVIKPDGLEGYYDVVETRGASSIVALDENHNVYFVGLHRYTTDTFSIEIPGGGIENENPLVTAKRELEEETGLVAKNWKQLGMIHSANGILDEENYIFLATGLSQVKNNHQQEEGIVRLQKIPFEKVLKMIKNGEITDAQSIAPIMLAALELNLV